MPKIRFTGSEALTPSYNRRTVYGRVSRYRLDDYLSLFDFPSPNLSSERRFTTNVPLQRLFFMNSDFMQQQGELLARRLESETDSTARIQKAYRLLFGRAASEAEVRAGLDYLRAEPMRDANDWLNRYQKFWTERFDRLAAFLEEDKWPPSQPNPASPSSAGSTRRQRKFTRHWLDRLVRGGTLSTHIHMMRRISRSTRGRAAVFAKSCLTAAELSTLG